MSLKTQNIRSFTAFLTNPTVISIENSFANRAFSRKEIRTGAIQYMIPFSHSFGSF